MTWVFEAEDDASTQQDVVIDASLFNIDAHEVSTVAPQRKAPIAAVCEPICMY